MKLAVPGHASDLIQTEAQHGGPQVDRHERGKPELDNTLSVDTGATVTRALNVSTDIYFTHIREICEKDNLKCDIDLRPTVFAEHRRTCWPDPDLGAAKASLADIYRVVKATGVPNAMSASY